MDQFIDEVQHFIVTGIHYLVIWFSTRPPSTWVGLIMFTAGVLAIIGLTMWKRRKFLRATGEKLGTKLTLLNVAVWSNLIVVSQWAIDFLANNSAVYGVFIPKEYVSHVAVAGTTAVAVHALSSELLKIWVKHKEKKASLPQTVVDSIKTAADALPETRKEGEPVTTKIWS